LPAKVPAQRLPRRRVASVLAAAALVGGAVLTIAVVELTHKQDTAVVLPASGTAEPVHSSQPSASPIAESPQTTEPTPTTTVPSFAPSTDSPPPWTYTYDVPAGEATVDLGVVGTTDVRIVKTSSSICIMTDLIRNCQQARDPAGQIAGPSGGVIIAGGSTSDGGYLNYWIAAPGVGVQLLDSTGVKQCETTSVSVDALGGAEVSMCETRSRPDRAASALHFDGPNAESFDLALG
ncbi:MAG: hypothetical protein JWN39_3149, partial [Ilumatobacteraceae bacterium]|nr:hypothetical protein [Ilumatobacteraceae bacterium]